MIPIQFGAEDNKPLTRLASRSMQTACKELPVLHGYVRSLSGRIHVNRDDPEWRNVFEDTLYPASGIPPETNVDNDAEGNKSKNQPDEYHRILPNSERSILAH